MLRDMGTIGKLRFFRVVVPFDFRHHYLFSERLGLVVRTDWLSSFARPDSPFDCAQGRLGRLSPHLLFPQVFSSFISPVTEKTECSRHVGNVISVLHQQSERSRTPNGAARWLPSFEVCTGRSQTRYT